jgi:putative FmdB family regulatory protein
MIYEYWCSFCETLTEREQRMTDVPLEVCERCETPGWARVVSGGAGFVLSGPGWFRDGYSKSTGNGKVG